MADPISDPLIAGERLLAFAREGRLVQRVWHDEEDGREIACLLGAAAGIDDPDECTASLMPAWVAHALPGLFDGQTEAHAQTFARRWGEAMIRDEWARIDWDAVRAEWLKFVVQQAKDAAAYAAAARAAARADAAADAADASYAAAYAAAASAAAARAAAAAAAAAAYAVAVYAASDASDDAADAADAAYAAAYAAAADEDDGDDAARAARDAQADALMDAIERAMGVA
ncbi:MAG: hypothetical protein ACK52I_06875 [Pseudomonadota bacterium]